MEFEFKKGNQNFENPIGLNKELYEKDVLQSQKILIVMLWTFDLNKTESEFIKPEYILKPNNEEEIELKKNIEEDKVICIKSAADHYGIE